MSSHNAPILSPTITAPGITVYLLYDQDSPPPHPGPQWTRFVCLSDTHSKTFKVPDGDVLLHSGDLSSYGMVHQLKVTMNWLCSLPHPTKIIIAGNHDLSLHENWYKDGWVRFHSAPEKVELSKEFVTGEDACSANIVYLEYDSTEIQPKPHGRKWKVYGSPGSPFFGGWAFNYLRGEEAKELHDTIPEDTDILLTHGPPFGILDRVLGGEQAGCEELRKRLNDIRPKLHIFGHIHEDRGAEIHEWSPGNHRTVFVNAANMPMGNKWRQLDRNAYKIVGGPGNQPIIVDFLDDTVEG